jgi:transposase
MGLVLKNDRWRISDELWADMKQFLPPPMPHPLGCHRPRVPDRDAMNAILYVARTGCQWAALDVTCFCKHSAAHRRFQEWVEAGVFEQFWIYGLLNYDELQGIDWRFLSMDGAMTKAPLGGKKNRAQSHRPRQDRHQAEHPHRRQRHSLVGGGGGRQSQRLQAYR